MSINVKALKVLASQIQQYIKRIIYYDQTGFIQGLQRWFNTEKQSI